MSKFKKLASSLAGVSGEYSVAAELSRRGYICSMTIKNTKGIDILVYKEESNKSIGIQVKTTQIEKPEWALSAKDESVVDESIVYVFVMLKSLVELPEYYIVPSNVVANYIYTTHREWLSQKGKKGQVRKDSEVRKFKDMEKKYKGRWDLLGI